MGNNAARFLNTNADIITAGAALVGLVTTVVLAVKETPRAERILDDARYDIERAETEDEVRRIKLMCARDLALNYAPAGVSLIFTGGCIVGTNRISRSRNAALTGLINAGNLTFQEYKEHMREELGDKKFHEIDDSFEEKRINKRVADGTMKIPQEVYQTGYGNKLYSIDTVPGDPTTRIYFRSSPERVAKAELEFNADMVSKGELNAGVYADYLWYQGVKDAIKYNSAMNYYHVMEHMHDFVEARLHEYEEHPFFHEHWCHIDFDPDTWEL
jgi:hypothetical protein